MGYLVKNEQIKTGSTSIRIPTGTTAARPTAPKAGQLRYNTDTTRFEFYDGSAWQNVASRGKVGIVKDTFTGNGSTTVYTLSQAPASNQAVPVYVGNVHQNPGTAYTISSTTLTFATAPPNAQVIEVYHGFDSTDR